MSEYAKLLKKRDQIIMENIAGLPTSEAEWREIIARLLQIRHSCQHADYRRVTDEFGTWACCNTCEEMVEIAEDD